MLSELLLLLCEMVNDHFSASSLWNSAQPDYGRVVFLDSDKLDLLEFKLGAITLLVVNLAQEHAMRPADPHRMMMADGTTQTISPPIYLNVDVMFVAHFKKYEHSLLYVSALLKFFQCHRFLDHENTPALSPEIEKLTIELLTLPLQDQQNLWSLLRSAYQPSLLYRLRTLVVQSDDLVRVPPVSTVVSRLQS